MTGLDELGADHDTVAAVQHELATAQQSVTNAAARLRALEPLEASSPLAVTARGAWYENRPPMWWLGLGMLTLGVIGMGVTGTLLWRERTPRLALAKTVVQ